MLPIDETLVETTDYLRTATDLHIVACGAKGQDWHPKVRGYDDGAEVGVAWYGVSYEYKADATKRAREMLAIVKRLRSATP
jgi:fatty-acid desaturase